MRILWLIAAFVMAATVSGALSGAHAEDLVVRVVDGEGHPVSDSVIALVPQKGVAPPTAASPETRVIDQKDETFVPYVQIMRPGDTIVFRNSDNTRHHVYSFSKVKAFEFVLTPGESSAPMPIDKTGIAVIGCNIHDNMIAYLFVSDAPWLAQTAVGGTVTFAHLPAGEYTARIWHPQLRTGQPEIRREIAVTGATDARTLDVALTLAPDPRQRMDHERMRY
jgi:plastocyanin